MNVIYKFENCLVNIFESIIKINPDLQNNFDKIIRTPDLNKALYLDIYKLYSNNDEMLHQLSRKFNLHIFTYFDVTVVENILNELNYGKMFSSITQLKYSSSENNNKIISDWLSFWDIDTQLNYYVGDQLVDYEIAEIFNFKFIHAKWSYFSDKTNYINSFMNCRDGYDLVEIL
jgi:phosphoglycolate phosphatase-like HAD superfamily hydrolase